jgi:hypothetical protein
MKCEYKLCNAEAVVKITRLKTNKSLTVCVRHALRVIEDIEKIEGEG